MSRRAGLGGRKKEKPGMGSQGRRGPARAGTNVQHEVLEAADLRLHRRNVLLLLKAEGERSEHDIVAPGSVVRSVACKGGGVCL